jgi:hypothetical protein
MLGPTSIKVTERYTHFAPGALRNVVNATRPTVQQLSTAIPADLSKYSELLSGADATRIRGLGRDRPETHRIARTFPFIWAHQAEVASRRRTHWRMPSCYPAVTTPSDFQVSSIALSDRAAMTNHAY